MEKLSKPSINRLSRRAGVKSLSDDCYETIRNLIGMKMTEIIKNVIIVNNSNQNKTISSSDIYKTFELLGENITASANLNTTKNKI